MSSVCAQSGLEGSLGGGGYRVGDGTVGAGAGPALARVRGEGLRQGGGGAGRRICPASVSWLWSIRLACGLASRDTALEFREVTPTVPDPPLIATLRLRERKLISLCSVHIF